MVTGWMAGWGWCEADAAAGAVAALAASEAGAGAETCSEAEATIPGRPSGKSPVSAACGIPGQLQRSAMQPQ